MAENKKSFVAYCDWKEIFDSLTDEKAGQLAKHLFSYVNDENPECTDPMVKIAFIAMRQQLKRDLKKWDKKSQERSESARVGNLKRWHPDIFAMYSKGKISLEKAESIRDSRKNHIATKDIANVAVNDTVTVTVNDTVSTNVDSDSELSAYDFLKKEDPSKVESFEMQNKKSIPDFDVFIQNFNAKVITEEIPFESKKLHARLMQLNANWDRNKKINGSNEPTINRQTADTIRKNSTGW